MPLKTTRGRWSSAEIPHSPPRSGSVSTATGSRPWHGSDSWLQRQERPNVAYAGQRLERQRLETLAWERSLVPEPEERIRRRRLPAVAEAFRELGQQRLILGLARMRAHRSVSPPGVDPARAIAGRIIRARQGIERQVDV